MSELEPTRTYSNPTATEVLRRLLDERGVEYETDDTQVSDTEWYYVTKLRDGCHDRWIYEEPPDCDLLVSYQYDLGAEDAIAATLGAGTCKLTMDGTDGCFGCSECLENIPPLANFCPNCGRKVVDA